jgi:hypothetical protein
VFLAPRRPPDCARLTGLFPRPTTLTAAFLGRPHRTRAAATKTVVTAGVCPIILAPAIDCVLGCVSRQVRSTSPSWYFAISKGKAMRLPKQSASASRGLPTFRINGGNGIAPQVAGRCDSMPLFSMGLCCKAGHVLACGPEGPCTPNGVRCPLMPFDYNV